MSRAWGGFHEELARWRDAGRAVEFWWRDDDAARPDPALERLLALAARSRVPLALAVVPAQADPAIFSAPGNFVSVIQHGTDHANRAASGEKKTEFPASEPAESALARLDAARQWLATQAGDRFLAILAPPWNRLPGALVPLLAGAGFRGLSQYGPRASAEPAPGVRQVNTHVDVIAWRSSRGFVGDDEALGAAVRHLAARRAGLADAGEATGWLTHHAVHDRATWNFLERLFETTLAIPGVEWRRAGELFHVS